MLTNERAIRFQKILETIRGVKAIIYSLLFIGSVKGEGNSDKVLLLI